MSTDFRIGDIIKFKNDCECKFKVTRLSPSLQIMVMEECSDVSWGIGELRELSDFDEASMVVATRNDPLFDKYKQNLLSH